MLSDVVQTLRFYLPALFIPPQGLLWLPLLALVFRRRRPRLAAILTIIGIAGLYALSTPVVSAALINGLQRPAVRPNGMPPPGAIVVLGAETRRIYPEAAEPGPLSLERLAGGARLARQTNLPVLMTGGIGTDTQPAVATVMAIAFEKVFGLSAMWVETASANTCENARFTAAMLRQAGIESAIVVTHSWHMPRTLLSFERAGYPVVAAPLAVEIVNGHDFLDYVPHVQAWARSYYAFHEWIGLAGYRLGACPRSDT